MESEVSIEVSPEVSIEAGVKAPLVKDEPTNKQEPSLIEEIISLEWVDLRIFPPIGWCMCGIYCCTFTALFAGKYLGYTSVNGIVQLVIFWTLGLLYLISYSRGALGDPGSVPKEWKDGPTGDYCLDDDPEFKLSLKENRSYWCKKCNHYKPPRTHHCSKCKRCVLRMDHHCIWLSGCVGYYNHKFFILTTLYSLLICWYVFFTSCILWLSFSPWISLQEGEKITVLNGILLFVGTALSFFQGSGLLWLSKFQLHLVLNNQTNIEQLCCNGKQPGCYWDQGSYWTNTIEVMGDNPLLWLIPVAHKRHYDPDVDGIFFDQPEDMEWDEEEEQNEAGKEGEGNKDQCCKDESCKEGVSETTPLV